MDLSIKPLSECTGPLLVVPLTPDQTASEDLLEGVGDGPRKALERSGALGDFSGRKDDQLLVHGEHGENGFERILFLGIGPSEDVNPETLRGVGGRAIRAAEPLGVTAVSIWSAPLTALPGADPARWGQSLAEAMVLASWRYEEGQTPAEDAKPPVAHGTLITEPNADSSAGWNEGIQIGRAFGEGENLARTLQARPGNVATPTHLAEEATRIANEVGLDVEILGPEEMKAEGMAALLSVAQGSDQEPRLIVLKHSGGTKGDPPLALVGKGLTFDAGGISIKPAAGMEEMKYDMSGGAAVLGAMWAIGRMNPSVNVVGVVPSSENLINGSATKPGDVIGSRAGKSIEVINTDAEGRLILADALDYTTDMNPAAIVDCATLTGACVIALGHHHSAVMGTDDITQELEAAGALAGEGCWRLPLGADYRKQLDSDFADLKNVGGRPGGSITAACFLSEFVGDTPWGHLDIAGTAYGDTKKPYLKKGPLGNPCRLLLEWVRARAA
ncbi:MAG: leucyl aminopeptidase [Longimicrobiales bacterium]